MPSKPTGKPSNSPAGRLRQQVPRVAAKSHDDEREGNPPAKPSVAMLQRFLDELSPEEVQALEHLRFTADLARHVLGKRIKNAVAEVHRETERLLNPVTVDDFEAAFASLGVTKVTFCAIQGWTSAQEHWRELTEWLRHFRFWEIGRQTSTAFAEIIYGQRRSDGTTEHSKTEGEKDRAVRLVDNLVNAIKDAIQFHESAYHVYHTGLASAESDLHSALTKILSGTAEFDDDLGEPHKGRRPRFFLPLAPGDEAQIQSERQIVTYLRERLVTMNPDGSKRVAARLARKLFREAANHISNCS